ALVIGFRSLVAQRENERHSQRVARVVVAEELSEGVCNTARNDRVGSTADDISTKDLRSSGAVLVVAGGCVQNRKFLIMRIEHVDIFVLHVEQRLAYFGAVLESDFDRVLKRRKLNRCRSLRHVLGA